MAVARPLWLQALTDYTAEEFRGAFDALIPSPAVITGCTVGPNNPVGMSVVVAPGFVAIQAKSGTGGKYLMRNASATAVAINPATAQPRVDIITARIRDTQYADAADAGDIVAVAGVPGANPVAPAVPAGSLLLATVAVAANAVSIAAAAITAPPYTGPGPVISSPMVSWIPNGTAAGTTDFTAAQWPYPTFQVGPSGMVAIDVWATMGNNFTTTSNCTIGYRLTGPQAVANGNNGMRAFVCSCGNANASVNNKGNGRQILTGLPPGVYTLIPIWGFSSGTSSTSNPSTGMYVSAAGITIQPL
jgi:hypothetical protein